jgi:hypothetical protein
MTLALVQCGTHAFVYEKTSSKTSACDIARDTLADLALEWPQ